MRHAKLCPARIRGPWCHGLHGDANAHVRCARAYTCAHTQDWVDGNGMPPDVSNFVNVPTPAFADVYELMYSSMMPFALAVRCSHACLHVRVLAQPSNV